MRFTPLARFLKARTNKTYARPTVNWYFRASKDKLVRYAEATMLFAYLSSYRANIYIYNQNYFSEFQPCLYDFGKIVCQCIACNVSAKKNCMKRICKEKLLFWTTAVEHRNREQVNIVNVKNTTRTTARQGTAVVNLTLWFAVLTCGSKFSNVCTSKN